ncbi:MAG: UDP-3-O-(3-hydroxymyristoyl)glucosamine N-acyltransferase [Acidobacteriota bacterium]|nr:MAG: UDP-3-O-(3-hydroxymyristoyl)glucosamine N-acyltransferase [Acidobacteriota bacterium]
MSLKLLVVPASNPDDRLSDPPAPLDLSALKLLNPPMLTLGQIVETLGCELTGDPTIEITGASPFELAQDGQITLATRKDYLQRLDETAASAVIVPLECEATGIALIKAPNPKLVFARVVELLTAKPFVALGVSKQAAVGRNCQISDRCTVHPFVSIGENVVIEAGSELHSGVVVGDNCRIGKGSTLYPNVTLYSNVTLGQRVILHSGVVIGADGFGYVFDGSRQVKVPQTGRVEIHDDVEIGANSCVDRATFGATVIERGVKIDNLVHIGHNCRIGEGTIIVGCVGISGSVEIGRFCVLAGQSGVADHVKIGDNVQVYQKTAVTKDVPAGSRVAGTHGRDYAKEMRIEAVLRRLPDLYRDVRELKKRIPGGEAEED